MSDLRVIDTHTHFYDPKRPQGIPWQGMKRRDGENASTEDLSPAARIWP